MAETRAKVNEETLENLDEYYFPRFNGFDPIPWIFTAEQFFEACSNVDDAQKIKFAFNHLDGDAWDWFDYFRRYDRVNTWEQFLDEFTYLYDLVDYRYLLGKSGELHRSSGDSEERCDSDEAAEYTLVSPPLSPSVEPQVIVVPEQKQEEEDMEVVESKTRASGAIGVISKPEATWSLLEGSIKLKKLFSYGNIWDDSFPYDWNQSSEINVSEFLFLPFSTNQFPKKGIGDFPLKLLLLEETFKVFDVVPGKDVVAMMVLLSVNMFNIIFQPKQIRGNMWILIIKYGGVYDATQVCGKMFEPITSKLLGAATFLLYLLPVNKNCDIYVPLWFMVFALLLSGIGAEVYLITNQRQSEPLEEFKKMLEKEVEPWDFLIRCRYKSRDVVSALDTDAVIGLILEMQDMGVRPNSSIMVALFLVTGDENELIVGKIVHCCCLKRGFSSDVVAATHKMLAFCLADFVKAFFGIDPCQSGNILEWTQPGMLSRFTVVRKLDGGISPMGFTEEATEKNSKAGSNVNVFESFERASLNGLMLELHKMGGYCDGLQNVVPFFQKLTFPSKDQTWMRFVHGFRWFQKAFSHKEDLAYAFSCLQIFLVNDLHWKMKEHFRYILAECIDDALRTFEERASYGIKPTAITYSTLLPQLRVGEEMSEARVILRDMTKKYIASRDTSIFIRLLSRQCRANGLHQAEECEASKFGYVIDMHLTIFELLQVHERDLLLLLKITCYGISGRHRIHLKPPWQPP